MSSSTAETGTYTTTAPGVPSVTPTLDNPAGYAKFNERRLDNQSVTNVASVTWVATGSSGASSESAAMSYTGSADSSLTSDKTTTVNVSAGLDSQSGSYTATGDKSELSTMGRVGDSAGPMYDLNWNYSSTLTNARSLTDEGVYPGGGLETLVSSGGRVWGETDVFSLHSPSINYSWTSGYTSSTGAPAVSVTQSDSLAQTAADPGPDAPQEAQDGQPPGGTPWWQKDPTGTMQALHGGYEFFTKDHGAEWANYYDRRNKNALNLSMTGDVAAFRAAESQAIKEQLNNVLQDGAKLANGVMAIGDVIGYGHLAVGLTKAGLSAGKGLINSSLVQCQLLQKACFAAGTPIKTPLGARFIETLLRPDQIDYRDEDDPTGPIRTGVVAEVFELTAQIWELYIGGRLIETTAEHPYFLVSPDQREMIGWTPLCRFAPGDLILGEGPIPTPVERIVQTNRTATVYNLRVEPGHTFFVGGDDWGFSLWVHNTPCGAAAQRVLAQEAKGGVYVLRDRAGNVVRTGRSKDLAARALHHKRDPKLRKYAFEVVGKKTDDYATQRGLEQMLYDAYPRAKLNKIRPIDPNKREKMKIYMAAATQFLQDLDS